MNRIDKIKRVAEQIKRLNSSDAGTTARCDEIIDDCDHLVADIDNVKAMTHEADKLLLNMLDGFAAP